jgi:hypothetical protein
LEAPYLNVLAEKEYTLPKFPKISAISWNKYLDKNVTCSVSFRPKNIDKDSESYYKVRSDDRPVIETEDKLIKNLNLDDDFVGPNLQYFIGVQSSSNEESKV